MRRVTSRFAAALALATATALVTAGFAGAAPIDQKKQQAAALEAEINANAEKLAALNEQIKDAQAKLDAANATIADSQSRIDAAQAENDRLEGLVRQRAASVYRSASSGGGDTTLFNVDVTEFSARERYASAASDRDSSLMDRLAAAKADLEVVKKDAQQAKAAAETEKAQLDAITADFAASNAERERLLAQVNGEIKALVDQAAAARVAKTTVAFDPSKVPPASGKAGIAVSFAEQQLGKAYCTGGHGPTCFDCSGLTAAAWAAAGVSIPSQSEAQLNSLPEVPMSQLAPGDILWRPDHVGIYVGGGTVIHATHPGSVVSTIGVGYFERAVRPG
jgi:cell wall-associated NlpC family hydrolase